MSKNPRCLYEESFKGFLNESNNSVTGELNNSYHGDVPTTSREAWISEVAIMKETLAKLDDHKGKIIFEYDIPRLGKRIDVVLLYRGIVFCIEFKVGEKRVLIYM